MTRRIHFQTDSPCYEIEEIKKQSIRIPELRRVRCSLCEGSGYCFSINDSAPKLRWDRCIACLGEMFEPVPNGATHFDPMSIYMIVGDSWNRAPRSDPKQKGTSTSTTVEPLPGETNFASVAHRLGWFKSASDARKSGWDAPLKNGSHTVGKRTIEISQGPVGGTVDTSSSNLEAESNVGSSPTPGTTHTTAHLS